MTNCAPYLGDKLCKVTGSPEQFCITNAETYHKGKTTLTYMKSPIMRFPSLHVKVRWLKLSDLKQHLLSDLLQAIKQESALYFLFNIWLSYRYFPQFDSNNILNLLHYSSSRPEARSLEKGIKQAWFKRESNCIQGPGSQCDGVRFVMLDECLVNHTPTPWLHPARTKLCGSLVWILNS